MAWLRILSGRGQGSTFDVGQRTFTLGRSPGNFVQLLANDVSRRHCQFRWEGPKCVLLDLNSQNGVLVNDRRVAEHELSDGDRISVGKTVLQFRMSLEMSGAEDHALRWKEIRAELTGGSTTSLRQDDVSGMLGALRESLYRESSPASQFAGPVPVSVARPAGHARGAPRLAAPGFPEDDASRLLGRLARVPTGTTLSAYLGEVAAEAGRLMGACRVCVVLRRFDAAGLPFLAPALTWVRPNLPKDACKQSFLSEVLRRALSESAAVGAVGSGPEGPACALAVPLAASTNWYGLLYVDSFEAVPGPFTRRHLEFLASLSAAASAFLASRGG